MKPPFTSKFQNPTTIRFLIFIYFFNRELLRLFMCKELINFKSLLDMYGKELLAFEIFSQETAHGKKCWTELNTRVIEHVSTYLSHGLEF